jgi:hypothetical protein
MSSRHLRVRFANGGSLQVYWAIPPSLTRSLTRVQARDLYHQLVAYVKYANFTIRRQWCNLECILPTILIVHGMSYPTLP